PLASAAGAALSPLGLAASVAGCVAAGASLAGSSAARDAVAKRTPPRATSSKKASLLAVISLDTRFPFPVYFAFLVTCAGPVAPVASPRERAMSMSGVPFVRAIFSRQFFRRLVPSAAAPPTATSVVSCLLKELQKVDDGMVSALACEIARCLAV